MTNLFGPTSMGLGLATAAVTGKPPSATTPAAAAAPTVTDGMFTPAAALASPPRRDPLTQIGRQATLAGRGNPAAPVAATYGNRTLGGGG